MEGEDRRTRAIPELTEGTLVLCRRPPDQSDVGLASKWLGSLRTIKRVVLVSYTLRDVPKLMKHRVQHNQIILYCTDDESQLIMPEDIDQNTQSEADDIVAVLLLVLVRSP